MFYKIDSISYFSVSKLIHCFTEEIKVSGIKELKNLNKLNHGLNKQWIWGSKENFYLSQDYLQKISYSIQDLNAEIQYLSKPTMKEVIYVIVLIDWINESIEKIQYLLKKELGNDYIYQDLDLVLKAKAYLRAIRSFVVAHPLSTNRHKKYGLDGDFICVDIRQTTSPLVKMDAYKNQWFYLSIDGMESNAIDKSTDFVLYGYSQSIDQNKFYKYIGVSFSDLYGVAELLVDSLYELDKNLKNLKKEVIKK